MMAVIVPVVEHIQTGGSEDVAIHWQVVAYGHGEAVLQPAVADGAAGRGRLEEADKAHGQVGALVANEVHFNPHKRVRRALDGR